MMKISPNPLAPDKSASAVPVRAAVSPSGLVRASMIGLAWLLANTIGSRAILFLSQIVLALILAPADFGAIAVAASISSVIWTVATFGIDAVLLSRLRTLRYWGAAGMAVGLALALPCLAVVLAVAALAPKLFGGVLIARLVCISAISMPLTIFAIVPGVALRSKLNFRFPTYYGLGELVVTQALAIALAYSGAGAYSFVIPGPLALLVRVPAFWLVVRPQICWKIRPAQWKYMLTSGANLCVQRLLITLRNYGDNVTLAALASPAIVGVYFFAFRLAVAPIQALTGSFSAVLVPALALLKNDPVRQARATFEASQILALVIVPLSFLQAAVAPHVLHLVFGDKWNAAAPILQILSIGLAFDVVPWIASSLIGANGRFNANLRFSLRVMPLFALLVIAGGIVGSAKGVACAVTAFFMISAPAYSIYVFKDYGYSARDVLRIYAAPVVLGAAAALAGAAVIQLPALRTSDIGAIAACGATAFCVYAFLVRVAAPDAYGKFKSRMSPLAARAWQKLASAARSTTRPAIAE